MDLLFLLLAYLAPGALLTESIRWVVRKRKNRHVIHGVNWNEMLNGKESN